MKDNEDFKLITTDRNEVLLGGRVDGNSVAILFNREDQIIRIRDGKGFVYEHDLNEHISSIIKTLRKTGEKVEESL